MWQYRSDRFAHTGIDAYYKTNGHAGYYIDLYPDKNALDWLDISLTFPTIHYSRNLFRLYGTSSEEIAENAREQERKLFLPQIEKLMEENNHLKQVLNQNNITY